MCDEVVAVGKADDELELPFPVLDDGSDERAPVFGVIAGLRAATHDDVPRPARRLPLVTPALLRELVARGAIPQTGPLPGVYTKIDAPGARAPRRRGELSLRGVNPTVVDVDDGAPRST